MVYGSLNIIAFLLFLKGNGVFGQYNGRVEFIQPSCGTVSSTSYIQPVGQVCFPAVLQVPDNCPNVPAPQRDDDDYLNLIYLLVSTIIGSNKGNSSPQPQQPPIPYNYDCYNDRSCRGYVCDECSRNQCQCQCPYKAFHPFFGVTPNCLCSNVGCNSDIQSLYTPSRSGCVYVPYPVPIPVLNKCQPGNNCCDPCYDYEDYPNPYIPEINLIFKTECAN